jgi:hypothetical protein
VLPTGLGKSTLTWTHFGYVDDDEQLTELRLKQSNLVGPAGYISLEDGVVGGLIQRVVEGAGDANEVVEMGGRGIGSQESRVTETPLRGFWKVYREFLHL